MVKTTRPSARPNARRRKYVDNANGNNLINETKDDDFNENVSSFLTHLRTLDRSPHTLEFYQKELRKFMVTLENNGVKTNLKALTSEIITREYIMYHMDELDAKYATIAATLRALRAFLNWAVDKERVIKFSPMEDVTIGKVRPRTIETFTRSQLRDLFEQPDLSLFVGIRDYAMLTLFIETGIRVRELSDIKLDDVRFSDNQILIRGKNGEDRLVPFQTHTRRVLREYIKARGESDIDNLFVSHDDLPMNRDSVRRRIVKYGRMANITNVRCSPHTFRHTFAKMYIQNGGDVFSLQSILGHKSMEMVRVYVNLFSNEVAEAHAKFSPIEHLNLK